MSGNMPFGPYKGQPLESVPTEGLQKALAWDKLYPTTRAELQAEVDRRTKPGPVQPLHPPHPVRAATQAAADPEAHRDPGKVRLCALDLIDAGETELLWRYANRQPIILAASRALRTLLAEASPPDDDEVPF